QTPVGARTGRKLSSMTPCRNRVSRKAFPNGSLGTRETGTQERGGQGKRTALRCTGIPFRGERERYRGPKIWGIPVNKGRLALDTSHNVLRGSVRCRRERRDLSDDRPILHPFRSGAAHERASDERGRRAPSPDGANGEGGVGPTTSPHFAPQRHQEHQEGIACAAVTRRG